jgi:DNA mismatch repair ATPase MutS
LPELPANRHIVSALAESACDESQTVSFRKAQEKLSKTAKIDSLLSHSTVWKLKQQEERHLEKAQEQFVEKVLEEEDDTLEENGFLPPPSKESAGGEVETEVFVEDIASEEIEEEADALYTHFTAECRKNESENNESKSNESVDTTVDGTEHHQGKRVPRHVPKDTILIQADEVVTKSQEPGRKQNKTYTATVETGWGRIEYLAARSSEKLQLLVAAILVLLGLFSGRKKLEVISDGGGVDQVVDWSVRRRGGVSPLVLVAFVQASL